MDKLGDWLNSVPLFGIAGISFAVGILYGKGLPGLEWETLIAGCLGLGGGAFALVAMRAQIAATEKTRQEDIKREETLNNEHYFALISETATHLQTFAISLLNQFDSGQWLNQALIKSVNNILKSVPIPQPPLTVESDVRNTVYGMMFIRSKVEAMLSEVEADMPLVTEKLANYKNAEITPPKPLIGELLMLRAYGAFLVEAIEDITNAQDI